MKNSSTSIGALTLALLPSIFAQQTPGTLKLDIARRRVDPNLLSRRADGSATASLLNNISASAYVVSVSVGTPPQNLTLQLDTGSSDTWVPATNASVCDQDGCFYGSFDANASSTFDNVLPGEFTITYGDETSSKGDYMTDVFSIGDASLKSLVMGLGIDTDIAFGLVGVGYPSNEAIEQVDPQNEYRNLPLELVRENITNTVAYSLWLNDLDSSTGSILFGGVDTDKYHGELTRLNLYPSQKNANVTEFIVALTSVTAVSSSASDILGSAAFPMAVLLDSGTTFTSLPTDLVNGIYGEVGAELDKDNNPFVACKLASSQGYFSFAFGGPGGAVVNVSMSELVIPGTVGQLSNKEDACQFAIYPVTSNNDPYILGDAFLRSAYVVFDLVNNEVGMAATDFNATTSNVVTFASQGASIPSSTPAPSQEAAALSSGAVTTTATTFPAASGFSSGVASPGVAVRPSYDGLVGVMFVTVMAVTVGFSMFFV